MGNANNANLANHPNKPNNSESTLSSLLQQKQIHEAYLHIQNDGDHYLRGVFLHFLITEQLFDLAYEYLIHFQENNWIGDDCQLLLLSWEIHVGVGHIACAEELSILILDKLIERKNFAKGLQLIGRIDNIFGMDENIKKYEIFFKILQQDEGYFQKNYPIIIANTFLEVATFHFLYELREQLFFGNRFFRQMLIDFLMRRLSATSPDFSLDLQKVFLHYLYDAIVFHPQESWALVAMLKYAAKYRSHEMFQVIKDYCRHYRDHINFSSNSGKELFVYLQIEDYPDWDQRYSDDMLIDLASPLLLREKEQLGNLSMILRNINFLKHAGEADQAGLLLKRLKFEGLLDEKEMEGTETIMGRSLINQKNQSKTEIFKGLLQQFSRFTMDHQAPSHEEDFTLEHILKSNINNLSNVDLRDYYNDIFVMCMELDSFGAADYLLEQVKKLVPDYDLVQINYLHCRVFQAQGKYFEAIEMADQMLTMELSVHERVSFLYIGLLAHRKRKSYGIANTYLKKIKILEPDFKLPTGEET